LGGDQSFQPNHMFFFFYAKDMAISILWPTVTWAKKKKKKKKKKSLYGTSLSRDQSFKPNHMVFVLRVRNMATSKLYLTLPRQTFTKKSKIKNQKKKRTSHHSYFFE